MKQRSLLANSILLGFISCFSVASWAADIVSINGMHQNGREVVQIELNEPIEFDPVAFLVQSPARISLDFPGVGVVAGRKHIDVNQGNLRSINAVEAGDRSRVVLSLREIGSYQIHKSGNMVTVQLGDAPSVRYSTEAVKSSSLSRAAAIEKIDFRRGMNGVGRVLLDLPNDSVGVDVRQEGKRIILEIPNVSLSDGFKNYLDVADFGTPVKYIRPKQTNKSTLVEIEVEGEWSQSSYQVGNQYVLEVHKVIPDPGKLTPGVGFSGEKLSLNFQNVDIRSLLSVIADFTNFNIVVADSVNGSLTLRLQDVPWDQALDVILNSKELGYEKNGNVLWVAPKDELNERRQKDHEARLALEKLEPLRTQSFQLNYARAEKIAEQLTQTQDQGSQGSQSGRFLTERGSAIAEPRTNQLFVTDTPSKLEEVVKLIADWDIPVRQVLIEARIVQANDSFGRNLGVRLGMSDQRAERGGDGGYHLGGGNRAVFGGTYGNVLVGSGAANGTTAAGQFFDLGANAIGSTSAASFALSVFNSAANRFLNLEISALESTGEGRVISSPRVVTSDQVKAYIEQGTELPYATSSPSGGTTVEFRKAVLSLEVTPQITPEGNVILKLLVKKDNLSAHGQGAIDTRRVNTEVLVENGGTVVIGGIFELDETVLENKVPFLGDLPIAGNLFKRKERSASKSELLVFITPKIVTEQNSMRR